jgi:hypothetical protein
MVAVAVVIITFLSKLIVVLLSNSLTVNKTKIMRNLQPTKAHKQISTLDILGNCYNTVCNSIPSEHSTPWGVCYIILSQQM